VQANVTAWLSGVVFGAVSIFGCLLALPLPETRNRPLPQTVEDIENWSRKTNLMAPVAILNPHVDLNDRQSLDSKRARDIAIADNEMSS
jgi:hypothetical protein